MSIFVIKGIILGVLGAVFGSFISMLSYRLPKGQDIVFVRSKCPVCKKSLQVLDLIPIFSFIIFRGRCRHCHTSIGIRYLLIELICVVLFMLGVLFANQLDLIKWLFFVVIGLSLAIIDVEEMILPDSLTVLLGAVGLVLAFLNGYLVNHFLAGLVGMGLFFLIRSVGGLVFKKEAMGIGDIKLIAALGCLFGFPSILWISYLSFLIGGVIVGLLFVIKGKKDAQVIPFGPAILLATCFVVFFLESLMVIIDTYFWQT